LVKDTEFLDEIGKTFKLKAMSMAMKGDRTLQDNLDEIQQHVRAVQCEMIETIFPSKEEENRDDMEACEKIKAGKAWQRLTKLYRNKDFNLDGQFNKMVDFATVVVSKEERLTTLAAKEEVIQFEELDVLGPTDIIVHRVMDTKHVQGEILGNQGELLQELRSHGLQGRDIEEIVTRHIVPNIKNKNEGKEVDFSELPVVLVSKKRERLQAQINTLGAGNNFAQRYKDRPRRPKRRKKGSLPKNRQRRKSLSSSEILGAFGAKAQPTSNPEPVLVESSESDQFQQDEVSVNNSPQAQAIEPQNDLIIRLLDADEIDPYMNFFRFLAACTELDGVEYHNESKQIVFNNDVVIKIDGSHGELRFEYNSDLLPVIAQLMHKAGFLEIEVDCDDSDIKEKAHVALKNICKQDQEIEGELTVSKLDVGVESPGW